jgi:hypothetical protein
VSYPKVAVVSLLHRINSSCMKGVYLDSGPYTPKAPHLKGTAHKPVYRFRHAYRSLNRTIKHYGQEKCDQPMSLTRQAIGKYIAPLQPVES